MISQEHAKADKRCQAEACFSDDMKWICHRSSLIRQSYHFATDFDHVLLQLVDIMNNHQFKYW